MASTYLVDDEKISRIARCLRSYKKLDGVKAVEIAFKHHFQLAEVERLLDAAVTVERSRREALNSAYLRRLA